MHAYSQSIGSTFDLEDMLSQSQEKYTMYLMYLKTCFYTNKYYIHLKQINVTLAVLCTWVNLKGLFNAVLTKQDISDTLQKAESLKNNTIKKKNLPTFSQALGQNSVHYKLADQNVTKSRQTRRASTHRPLSRPTPQTLMLTMGCECRTVRSMGSIRFSMSFSSIRYMSLPCSSRQSTVTQHITLSNWLGSKCYICAVQTNFMFTQFWAVPRPNEKILIYFCCERGLRCYLAIIFLNNPNHKMLF